MASLEASDLSTLVQSPKATFLLPWDHPGRGGLDSRASASALLMAPWQGRGITSLVSEPLRAHLPYGLPLLPADTTDQHSARVGTALHSDD